ncbi:GNAT family N-acetyltransferase [Flavobacterium maritimum]|jgi:ribosomal-protein-alanine N-acetyltransferase|uniref:GNAT family N-acetyltransferase n=1 Tax=Flavobacterium maritimum TaxID=3149042 RepID=UPI0032B492A6
MNHEIITDKLKLKIVENSDAELIHKLRTNPEVGKFIKRDLNKSLNDIENFIEEINKSDLFFSIRTLENNEFAGTIAIWNINPERKYAELGYELFPSFQNKGIMTNAINGILDYAFNKLDFEIIEAYTDKENQNSRKLLEKIGFNLVCNKIDKKNLNNIIYEIKKVCN